MSISIEQKASNLRGSNDKTRYIMREVCQTYFPKNEELVAFSSYFWLTYEMKYFYEDFENNSK